MLWIVFFNDAATTEIYTLSLHDALPISVRDPGIHARVVAACPRHAHWLDGRPITGVLPMAGILDCHRRFIIDGEPVVTGLDRKSTRLNSSHANISYAVFCL